MQKECIIGSPKCLAVIKIICMFMCSEHKVKRSVKGITTGKVMEENRIHKDYRYRNGRLSICRWRSPLHNNSLQTYFEQI